MATAAWVTAVERDRLSADGLTKPPLQQVLQRVTATNGCPPSEVCGDLQRHRLSTGSAVNQPSVRPVWVDRSRPVPESRRFDRGFDRRPTDASGGERKMIMGKKSIERLMTLPELSEMLGVPIETLYGW